MPYYCGNSLSLVIHAMGTPIFCLCNNRQLFITRMLQVLWLHIPNESLLLSVTKRFMHMGLLCAVILLRLTWDQNLGKTRNYHRIPFAFSVIAIIYMLQIWHSPCQHCLHSIAITVTVVATPHHTTVYIDLRLHKHHYTCAIAPLSIFSTQLTSPYPHVTIITIIANSHHATVSDSLKLYDRLCPILKKYYEFLYLL